MYSSEEALKFDKNFNGPVSQRSPTDLFWLKLFVGFLVCWFLIAFYGNFNFQYILHFNSLTFLYIPSEAFAYGNFDHLTRVSDFDNFI